MEKHSDKICHLARCVNKLPIKTPIIKNINSTSQDNKG
jgi:hypothetical protein